VTDSPQNQNVQEDLLRQKIDPYLTVDNLTALATEALGVRTVCDGYTVLTGGCWNRVIAAFVDGGKRRLVIKVTPRVADPDLEREFAVLRFFRAHTSLPVPQPYLLDVSGARVPGSLIVMASVPGTVLTDARPRLSSGERELLSTELAEIVADLNARQEAGFGGVELPAEQRPATWPEFYLPRFDGVLAEAEKQGLVPGELLAELHQLRSQLPRLLDIGPRGALTHFDIWTGNVMVDFRDGRPFVSGILEPCGYFADYAREIASLFSLADERFMQVYEQRHGLDESYGARFSLYTLKMSLQLAIMYPADPAHVECARQHLRRVQAHLDRQ
jgi:fructosamine-3-kinase